MQVSQSRSSGGNLVTEDGYVFQDTYNQSNGTYALKVSNASYTTGQLATMVDQFAVNENTVSLRYQGNVKLETTNAGVTVIGTATADDFDTPSDARVKENISTSDGLYVVNQLRGVEYNKIDTGKLGSGVIAQELEEVLPHLVNTDKDDKKTVNYNGIIAYLIESIKELSAEVEQLKNN